MSTPATTTVAEAFTRQQIRRWVANYWVDRMQSRNAPDLPEWVSIEDFEAHSERLARRIAP